MLPSRPSGPRLAIVLLVAGVAGAQLTGCSGGSPVGAGGSAGSSSPPSAGAATCPVGRWSVPAAQEFAQIGLGTLTRGSVTASSGTIRISFASDHTYAFTYDRVRLTIGRGAGTASVTGPVQGTWTLAGDRLTTKVTSSRIAVSLSVDGAEVPPSETLNQALRSGIPATVRVRCSGRQLTATITSGAVGGRAVTFTAG